jgi:hypothetical protein
MDLSHNEPLDADALYARAIKEIDAVIRAKNLDRIRAILKTLDKIKPGDEKKRSQEMIALNKLRSQGYITKLFLARDKLSNTMKMYENSGYIPSESEKNDPRWKTALSVDVNPYTLKKSAKKFGWNIKRDGRPPILR